MPVPRVVLCVLALAAWWPALSAAQPARPPLVVDPRDYGAACDGRALGRADILEQDYAGALVSAPSDCTMTAGSAVLTCASTVPFTAGDVGKVIAVYGAGPVVTGHVVPLATTIASYQSAGQVTLAAPAATSVTASEHVVWGTNDDAAMQAAVDALADRGGGVLQSPPGTCLTRGIVLPCADIGDFRRAGYLECRRRYHDIHIKGVSRARSRWENWDPHTSVDPLKGHIAMIALGFGAEIPGAGGNAPPGRLRNIEVSDLSFWLPKHTTEGLSHGAVTTGAVDGLVVRDTETYAHDGVCYHAGGGAKTVNVFMHHNLATVCGLGGPKGSRTTGAFTSDAAWAIFSDNVIRQSGQCFEITGHDVLVKGNTCDGTGLPEPAITINVSSGSTGAWNIAFLGNRFVNLGSGGFQNVLGTMSNIRVEGNEFIDITSLGLGGGREANNVKEGLQPPSVHGTSTVIGNTFLFTSRKAPAGHLFQVAGNLPVLESWVIDRNTVVYETARCTRTPFPACRTDADCSGGAVCQIPTGILSTTAFGGARWRPSHTYAVGDWVVPVVWNGLIYRCTTAGTSGAAEPSWPAATGGTVPDGGAVWTVYGLHPSLALTNLTLAGPLAARPFGYTGAEVQIDDQRAAMTIRNITSPYSFRVVGNSLAGTGAGDQVSGPGGPYDDRTAQWTLRTDDTVLSRHGRYEAGTVIRRRAPVAGPGGEGWLVTRSGWAAEPWAARTAYAFGAFAVPRADNGHFFRIVNVSACTSGGVEPAWNTAAGALTADGTCSWKESGTAALFTPRP